MTVREIYDAIDRIAPFQTAMDFDNVGILVGDENVDVTKTLLCLDVTPRVLREAKSIGVELIISHHPVIFNPLRTVQPQNIIYALVQSGIAVISAHTNLDMAYPYGVNDALCRKLGLQNVCGILKEGETDIAYMGELPEEMTTEDFAAHIKEALGLSAVRCTAVSKMLRTVAVVGGAGGDYALAAQAKGADAFVTGAATCASMPCFPPWLPEPRKRAGHYHTELPYRERLKAYLDTACPGVEFIVSESERPPMETL